jgi:hypothetical protein
MGCRLHPEGREKMEKEERCCELRRYKVVLADPGEGFIFPSFRFVIIAFLFPESPASGGSPGIYHSKITC